MPHTARPWRAGAPSPASPLMLCDRLLTLAEDADGAGFIPLAEQLLGLAYRVLDEPVITQLAA